MRVRVHVQVAKHVVFHGAVYGDGVYVASNARSFRNYGNMLVVCAVLRWAVV